MHNTMDSGCERSLMKALGHAAPFSSEELAGLDSLTVLHARDISPLAGCIGLRHLRIVACELEDLMVLEPLLNLEHIEVVASCLKSLLGLASEARLTRIDLLYTSLTDASEVLGIYTWCRGTLIGNPWTEVSFGALRNEACKASMFVELPSEYDWQQSCRLWQRAKASCGYLANAHGFAIKPGLPEFTSGPFDAIALNTSTVDLALDKDDFSLAKLFADYSHRVRALSPDELSDLAQSRHLRSAAETRALTELAGLPDRDRDAVLRLLDRFPKVQFYGLSASEVTRKEQAFSVQLPTWYRRLAQLVDGWLPRPAPAAVRLDAFEGYSLRQDVASLTYMLGLRPAGDDTAPALRAAGFQIVGLSQEHPQSTLAIRLRDDDPQVYEYSEEDLLDALSEGRAAASVPWPVFSSYAAMLGHIVSMHTRGEDPVSAT